MIVITLVFLILIVGLIMYLVADKPKIQEIGRIMFFCGLFAVCLNSDRIYTLLNTR